MGNNKFGRRMPKSFRRQWLGILVATSIFSGCHGPLPGIGSTNLQSPTRVPAPATGSFPVPGAYSPGSSSTNSSSTSPVGTGVVPLNNQTSSLPSTSPSTVTSGLRTFANSENSRSEGWHASDLGAVTQAGFISSSPVAGSPTETAQGVATASFERMTSRLTDDSRSNASSGEVNADDREGTAVEEAPASWRKPNR